MINFFQKQKKIKNGRFNSGFTIVETIVALFIFSVSITAMMGVLARGIQNTNYAKNKLTATYLAQEGIEHIRNLRDNYVYFSGINGWKNFLIKLETCSNGISCIFDNTKINFTGDDQMINSLFLIECSKENCLELKYDSSNGSYGYSGKEYSGFIRKININESTDRNYAIEVVSTVSFKNGSVSFSEYLYNLTPL